ncbi:MAG: hypothetical protein KDE33_24120, partial [Bacteroidetes bacterium]|nr:hypothetical protein [Bacteroidota bacterium]
ITTFHCVYPTNSDLFSKVSIDLLFAYLLTEVSKDIFSDNRREYGNGLKKFEPNDLNKSKMLDLSILSQSKVEEILELYSNYRQTENEKYIAEIDLILRNEYSNAKPKIAKEYAFADTNE